MPQSILDFIQSLIQHVTSNATIALPSVVAAVIGLLVLRQLSQRRQMLHQERMASLIRGLHYAGVAKNIFSAQQPQSRDFLMKALRWLLGGSGLAAAIYLWMTMQPGVDKTTAAHAAAVGAMVPGGIGLSHLIGAWVHRPKKPTYPTRMYYRAG